MSFTDGLMTGANLGRGMYRARGDRQVGAAMAQGNFGGAAAAAYGQGDLQTGQALDTQARQQAERKTALERSQVEQRTEALMSGVRYLQSVPAEMRPQAFAQMRAQLGTVFDPELLDQLSGADMSDQSLNAFGAALGAEAERLQLFQTRGGDIVGVSQTSGRERSRIAAPAEAFDPMEGAPQGFRWADEQRSRLTPIPGYVEGRSQISAAGRAPPRPRSGGGGGSAPRSSAPATRAPWERF